MAVSYSYFLAGLLLRADEANAFPSCKPIRQGRVLVGEGVRGGGLHLHGFLII